MSLKRSFAWRHSQNPMQASDAWSIVLFELPGLQMVEKAPAREQVIPICRFEERACSDNIRNHKWVRLLA